MKKVLITYNIPSEGLTSLKDKYTLIHPSATQFTKEEIIAIIPECEAILTIFNQAIDKDIIEAGTNLKIISNYGVGYNNIDVDFATSKGITVCNTPESVCTPTAELCMGLILSLSRRIAECNHRLRVEKDFKWGVMENLGIGLKGKTLGIIGMGKIGKELARMANTFGLNIIYNKRNRYTVSEEKSIGVKYIEFEDLLKSSDIISIHVPLTTDTHHLISKTQLLMMKQTALLINTARGAVINESDLVEALEANIIKGAALDVFEYEPKISSQLFNLNNVIIVPHIGTATIDCRIEMGREAGENIINFFNDSPTNIVN